MLAKLKLAVVIASMLLAACTGVDPYRTAYDKTCDLTAITAGNAPDECGKASVETSKDFDITYVEFSDQGWLYQRDQLNRTLAWLKKPDPRPLQIVVFVHGWKHSARFEDSDVRAFRETVMPAMARNHPGFRTVGVYVGWRGASLDLPSGPQSISFYDRKSTADHVARGSVRELFSHLRAMRNQSVAGRQSRVSITLVGHSFGGLILYNSIAESLLDTVVAANSGDPAVPREAKAVFDLVVLLNPAFEATRFEPLFQAAKDRLPASGPRWAYAQVQRPVFVSITSEADSATRVAFPIGRFVNSTFQHEGWTDQDDPAKQEYAQRLEKVANNHTIGHMERYRTHRLTLSAASQPSQKTGQKFPIACALAPNTTFANENFFPLWNLYAAADVIDGHHDIYRENLWDFISRLGNRDLPLDQICK